MNRSATCTGLVALAALLTGCATSGGYGWSGVPAGSALVLNERLTLPPGAARVFIQHGQVVAEGDVDRFLPSCYFGLERRGDEALADTIREGRFEVLQSSRSWAQAGLSRDGGVRVAAIAMGVGVGIGGFRHEPGSLQRLTYHTAFELHSERQPQVDDLHCRYNGYAATDRPLTFEEIDETLGDLATLKRPTAAD